MKIWLNDRKIKEVDHFIMCDGCCFMRETGKKYTIRCLAKVFNLYKRSQICRYGYQYEDKV